MVQSGLVRVQATRGTEGELERTSSGVLQDEERVARVGTVGANLFGRDPASFRHFLDRCC
jgi:hypothetical protein